MCTPAGNTRISKVFACSQKISLRRLGRAGFGGNKPPEVSYFAFTCICAFRTCDLPELTFIVYAMIWTIPEFSELHPWFHPGFHWG